MNPIRMVLEKDKTKGIFLYKDDRGYHLAKAELKRPIDDNEIFYEDLISERNDVFHFKDKETLDKTIEILLEGIEDDKTIAEKWAADLERKETQAFNNAINKIGEEHKK